MAIQVEKKPSGKDSPAGAPGNHPALLRASIAVPKPPQVGKIMAQNP